MVAIELDDRLPPILAETLAEFKNVTIVQGDAMVLDLPALIAEHFAGMPVVVCANLPYYITSPIIMRLLEGPLPIRSLTVMVQKGGRGAHYGGAGHPGMRGYQRGGVVLQHAEAAVPGLTGVFFCRPRRWIAR